MSNEKENLYETKSQNLTDDNTSTAPPAKKNLKKEVLSWVLTVAIAVLVVILVDAFVAKSVIVQSISMNDTLVQNDKLVVTKIFNEIKKGEIIVFHANDARDFLKRVIAVEGDTIDIDFNTGDVIINGEIIDEPYIKEPTTERFDFIGPITIPKGSVFVMGDNRNRSSDSRDNSVGLIDVNKVFGKVLFRFYPFNKIGAV